MPSVDFIYAGETTQTWTVPAGVTKIDLTVRGGGTCFQPAEGEAFGLGAWGYRMTACVLPGDELDIRVGRCGQPDSGGWPDGGDGGGGFDVENGSRGYGGGGSTTIWRNGQLWLVAAGAGGLAGSAVNYEESDYNTQINKCSFPEVGAGPFDIPADPPPPLGPGYSQTAWTPGATSTTGDGADGLAYSEFVGSGGGGGGYNGGASGGVQEYEDEEENAYIVGLPGLRGASLLPSTYWKPGSVEYVVAAWTGGNPFPPPPATFEVTANTPDPRTTDEYGVDAHGYVFIEYRESLTPNPSPGWSLRRLGW